MLAHPLSQSNFLPCIEKNIEIIEANFMGIWGAHAPNATPPENKALLMGY